MVQRQVIRFGKSAFCITLPQSWATKNNLKKGDSISVQETLRNSLEVVANIDLTEAIETAELDITDKSIEDIRSFLLAAYLNGYSQIILRGINNGKSSYIRKAVNDFVAAEIMEVTNNKLSISVFSDVNGINLRSVIKRIENITRALFIETTTLLNGKINEKSDIQDILEMGNEVQRQVLLARRTTTYALNNSTIAHKFNFSSLELYYTSYIIYFLGNIGEYMVEISKIIYEERENDYLDAKLQKELRELLESTLKQFEKTLDIYNKQHKRDKSKTNVWTEIEGSLNAVQHATSNKRMPAVPEYIKLIVGKIKEMEIFINNMENSPR